jgi:hypothetical protein
MTGRDWWWAALAVGLVLLLRLPLAGAAARPDEAGNLIVAGQGQFDDPALCGRYWVVRPPLLFALGKAAGGLVGLRLLGTAS